MSTMTLAGVIAGGMVAAIFIGAVIIMWRKRSQYMREAQGKLKCVFLPDAGAAYNKLVDVRLSGHEIAAPKEHHLPRYFFNKANTWPTKYPENPWLGLASLQVQISTVWYYEDNPEPITSQAVVSPHVATASMIFASIDSAFALVVHELDAELQKTKRQLLEALSVKLNKTVVYGLLLVLTVCVIVLLVMHNSDLSYMHKIGSFIGVK